jgi:hypothetical protein
VLPMDESVLQPTVLSLRVNSTAACMCYLWMSLFYSLLFYLYVSILQQTVLPMDESVLQPTVLSGRVCSAADFATWTCLFYSRLCYLDVSVLQQTLLSGRVCSTADFATWTFLFYSRLCYLDVSVLQQTLLPGRVCSTACPALRLERVCLCICCLERCLAFTRRCMSSRAYSSPVHVCVQELCAAPGSVCLRKHVLHLYVCFCAAPGRVCLQKLFCCSWTCLSTKAFVLLLDVSVYNSSAAAPGCACLQKLLCCSWTCLSTIVLLLLLEVSIYNSFCTAFRCDEKYADYFSMHAEHVDKNVYAC